MVLYIKISEPYILGVHITLFRLIALIMSGVEYKLSSLSLLPFLLPFYLQIFLSDPCYQTPLTVETFLRLLDHKLCTNI